MSYISKVIGWKFNNQEGMSCRVEEIVQFPGGIPTQIEQDAWTAEYEARDKTGEMLDSVDPKVLSIIESLTSRVLVLEGSQPITSSEFKDSLKTIISP